MAKRVVMRGWWIVLVALVACGGRHVAPVDDAGTVSTLDATVELVGASYPQPQEVIYPIQVDATAGTLFLARCDAGEWQIEGDAGAYACGKVSGGGASAPTGTGVAGVTAGSFSAAAIAGTHNQILDYNSSNVPVAVTVSGDVSNVDGVHTVSSLAAGNWMIQGSGVGIHGIYSSSGGSVTQTAPATDSATGPFSIAAMSAEAAATTNRTGGELDLYGGAGATTNGTPGNVDVVLGALSGSGSAPSFNVDYGTVGTHAVSFNPVTGLWTLSATATAPGLAQASESTTQTPTMMAFAPQPSTHATNQDSSGVDVDLTAPLGTGVDAYTVFRRGGVAQATIGTFPGGTGQGIWFGVDRSAVTTGNWAFLNYAGGGTYLSAPAGLTLFLEVGNTSAVGEQIFASGAGFSGNVTIGTITGGTTGGGTNELILTNGTAPTSACTGGTCINASGGLLVHTDANNNQAAILTGYATLAPTATQTLSAAQSAVSMLQFTGSTASAVTSALTPAQAKGALLFLRNADTSTVTFGWSTGTTCSMVTVTSALVTSDGTNCVILMKGT